MGRAVLYPAFVSITTAVSILAFAFQSGCSPVAIGESGARKVTLSFSTFLGGSGEDSIRDVATDSQGNIFVAGGTTSPNFPATAGSFDTSFNGVHDVFVAKLDPSGSIIWVTFIGGPEYDRAYAIEVDSTGVYVAGRAGQGFPTSPGCLQPSFGRDVNRNSIYGEQDGFITKLSPDGSQLIWSTFFGSDDREVVRDIAIDGAGNVYLATTYITRSHPHITSGAFQTDRRGPSDGVVAKLSSDGRSVVYAAYFGGTGDDGDVPSIRVDPAGNAYYVTHTKSTDAPVTPTAYQKSYSRAETNVSDLIVAKISADGARLIYSTYFGGEAGDGMETHSLAVDRQGNAYLGFTTGSTDLPTSAESMQRSHAGLGGSGTGKNTNYAGDGFVAKLSPDGSRLLASTYIGGRFGDGIEGIEVDAQGRVYISGSTYSDNFAVSADAYQAQKTGKADAFVSVLNPDLSAIIFGTYLGGREDDLGRAMAIEAEGDFYLAGMSKSPNWPTSNPLQSSKGEGWDAVIARIAFGGGTPLPLPKITGASVSAKNLTVTGENFAAGAEILLNDQSQKKTINDPDKPTTVLIAKKAGKHIPVGNTVRLQVRNPGSIVSEVFLFRRPPGDN